MPSLRVVLITPRYWPHAGDMEMGAARLAEGLCGQGAVVTVLTGSWDSEWPQAFDIHGVSVRRVAYAPRGGWSTFRYVTALRHWLTEHKKEIDVVCALTLSHEASAAIGAFRGTSVPIVLHVSDWRGPASIDRRSSSNRDDPRIRRLCSQANALVTSHESVREELVQHGCESGRVHVIRRGVPVAERRSADRRYRARAALAEVNHDLAAAEYAPVALCITRLDEFKALSQLIQGWQRIAASWPSARLWLIGDGPERIALRELVDESELRYQVFLPGSFEDWPDLFAAADVFVSPVSHRRSQVLLEAMANGLPVIAADGPDLRGIMEHDVHGWILSDGSPGNWSSALTQMLENAEWTSGIAAAARKVVESTFPLDVMAQAHLQLFESLRAKPRNE